MGWWQVNHYQCGGWLYTGDVIMYTGNKQTQSLSQLATSRISHCHNWQRAGSVVMGNTLMQHRLAIAGFKMPGMKLSWRKRMKKFKNTIREERAGRKLQVEARNGMMMLTKLVVLPLICALPRLWMSTQGESFSTPSLHSTQLIPSSTSCLGDLDLDKVRICQNISTRQKVCLALLN